MSASKLSVFITVIALHACVLGIVYVATRPTVETIDPMTKQSSVPPQETPKPEKAAPVVQAPPKPRPAVPAPAPERPVVRTTTTTTHTRVTETRSPAPAATGSSYIIHTVGANDYLSTIAHKYKVTAKSIIELNKIKNPDLLVLGQKLKIPKS